MRKLLVIFSLLITFISHAQSDEELELINRYWKDPNTTVLATEIPEEWKNESAIILKDHRYIRYINRGKNVISTVRKHQLIKIQDQSSLEEFSEIQLDKDSKVSFMWSTFLKEETIIAIRIIKPNGDVSIIDVQKEEVEEDNTTKIAVPNLEINDILDIIIQLEKKEKEFSGLEVYPAFEATLKDYYPLLDYRLAVEVENDFFLNMNTYNGAPKVIEEETDRGATQKYVVEAKNLDKIETSRWYYPLVEEPTIKYQVAFARNSKDEYYANIFKGKDGERKASVTQEDVLEYYKRKFKKESKGSVYELNKYIKDGNYKTNEEILRAALEYIRFHRYTKYFETIFAYQAKITTGATKQKCYGNYYGIYEYDSQVVNDLRAICNSYDIDYDVIMVQPRYDGKLDDLLIKDNARVGLKFNTSPSLYFFDFNESMTLERFPAVLEDAETFIGAVRKGKKITDLTRGTLVSTTADANVYSEHISLKLTADKKGFHVEREKIAKGHFEDEYIFNWIHFTDFLNEDYKQYPETEHFYQCGSKKDIKRQTEQFKAFEDKKYEEFVKNREEAIDSEWEDGKVTDLKMKVNETGRYGIDIPLNVEEQFTINDGYIKRAGKNLIVEIGKFIGGQVNIEEDERDRKVDVYLNYAKTFDYEIKLEVPEGYSVKGLDKLNVSIENSTGSFKAEAKLENNTLIINTKKIYKKNLVENKDWTAMTEWLDAAYDFSQAKVLLQQ